MAVGGNAELVATKADLISALVQKELVDNSMMRNFITDVSSFAVKGMKSISFPKFSSFTAGVRASAVAGTPSVITSTVDTLNLDIPAYLSWVYDENDKLQSTVDFQSVAAQRAAGAHSRLFDGKVITELLNIASLSVNGAAPADITRDSILDMRKWLLDNNADMNNVALLITPDMETAMLKIAEFTQAQIYGSAVIPNGMIGTVYGIPVFIVNSPELDDAGAGFQQALMVEKSGACFGFQKDMSYGEQDAIEYGTGAKLSAIDSLYGITGLQLGVDTAKHVIAVGKSPLVAKLAD